MVMMPKFNAKQAIKLIKARHNYLAGIPAMFEKMLAKRVLTARHKQPQTDILRRGQAQSQHQKRFDEILKKNNSTAEIFEGYGLSEVTSVATVNVKAYQGGHPGKPMFG